MCRQGNISVVSVQTRIFTSKIKHFLVNLLKYTMFGTCLLIIWEACLGFTTYLYIFSYEKMSRPKWTDDAFQAFAHPLRRELLYLLHECDSTISDIDDLSRTLATCFEDTAHEVRTQLHHLHLPRLQAVGFIDFDHRSGDIQYQPHTFVDGIIRSQVLDCLDFEEPEEQSI